jgi:aminoglycoside-2''-adenylyltransferase
MTEPQLSIIAEVVAVAGEEDVAIWLRGGWAMDFYLGAVTRPHVDVDWFVWADDIERLSDALERHGFARVGCAQPEIQRDYQRDGVEMQFAFLGRDRDGLVVVPAGPYAGESWPDGMLDHPSGRIGEVIAPIISPAAQIEIKLMMPVWVPGMPRRPKDLADVERLRAAVS